MKIIDAIGLACPQPVILAKRALGENPGEVQVTVDNRTATLNLSHLGQTLGRAVQVLEQAPDRYDVLFAPATQAQVREQEPDSYVVVLAGEEMGQGDPAFGRKLLEGFVYALTEQSPLPRYVLCYNRGVALSTENEKTVADLKALEEKGVQVLSCGLCLDFYGLKEKLQVGEITNMYRICELMTKNRVVRP